ncbi:hypothetical protein APSETT444_005358 [Aspergillus pseudonomiae]
MSPPAASDAPEKTPDDSSKLKTFLSILKKFIGVADIASVRFSLPAHLLEPTPNLGRGSGRILELFGQTRDLCKVSKVAYLSPGLATWEIDAALPEVQVHSKPGIANGTSTAKDGNAEAVKVCYLTEQTSHHPPVSAFFIDCPQRGVSARGFDQISAKFTGTSIRVAPGQHNLGIFVKIAPRDNEEYQLTHPAAHLGGLLRGALAITVSDTCYVTCPKTRIKVILQYLEDGWIGRAQNRVEGVVFRYDPDIDTTTKIKDVPESDILAKISGSWHGQVYYTLSGAGEPQLLIDITPLFPATKSVPPEASQLSNESRKFWSSVTEAIVDKNYNQATKCKQNIEERQRQKAAERQAKNEIWQPRFFTDAVAPLGKPELTEEGRKALDGLYNGDYSLKESETKGA